MKPSNVLSYALVKAHQHDSGGRQRLWAVATDKRGKILAEAGNSFVQSHPLQASYAKRAGREQACFLHAEMAMIVKMLRSKVDCARVANVFIARADKQGNPMLAKPCKICQMALDSIGVVMDNVIFTE